MSLRRLKKKNTLVSLDPKVGTHIENTEEAESLISKFRGIFRTRSNVV